MIDLQDIRRRHAAERQAEAMERRARAARLAAPPSPARFMLAMAIMAVLGLVFITAASWGLGRTERHWQWDQRR